MRHRPPEFDLDHDAARAEDGLPRLDETVLLRVEMRLRVAQREGGGAAIAALEVETLLAAFDTLRRLSSGGLQTAPLDEDELEP